MSENKFHVTRNFEGKPVDFHVLVGTPVLRQNWNGPPRCRCGEVYPVVLESVTAEHVKQGAHRDGKKVYL